MIEYASKMKTYSRNDKDSRTADQSAGQPDIPAGYAANYQEIAPLMGWFMLRQLGRIYREFKGDFVQAMVLGEVAHHNIHRFFSLGKPQTKDKPVNGLGPVPHDDLDPCNAFSLSEATGIPRETVRRKIAILVNRGWLKKHADGGYVIPPGLADHFAYGINLQTLKDFLTTSDELRKVLEREPENSKKTRSSHAPGPGI